MGMEDQTKKKYDRQLRIWGEHGQAKLLASKICLIKCGPTGSETLKNLVLGGISGFTIVDDAKVEASDLGNNFMLDKDSLGQSKAKCVTELLQEMAGDVSGSFVEEKPDTLVSSNPKFFADFSLVVVTQMPEHFVVKLDAVCNGLGVPLLIARSYGLAGTLRISMREHTVIETKPDNVMDDLRVHKPWPELLAFASSFDLATEDEMVHRHIPNAVILVQLFQKFIAAHGGPPSDSKGRSEFKDMIRTACRVDVSQADNFKEALSKAHIVWAPPVISEETKAILADPKADAVGSDTPDFWVTVAALRRFVAKHGDLPHPGAVPDMTSTTENYLSLQKIYQEKAARDVGELQAHVQDVLNEAGRDPATVPRSYVKQFAKHARHVRVVRTRTLAEETGEGTVRKDEIKRALEGEDTTGNMSLYLLLRAADRYLQTYGQYPGAYGNELEEDSERLKALAGAVLNEARAPTAELSEDLLGEVCRFGASELHVVAALMGGMAAQEAIKIMTEQFVPLAGTLVYNGMESTMTVFSL